MGLKVIIIIISLQPLSVIAACCYTLILPKWRPAERKSIHKNNLKRDLSYYEKQENYRNCKKLNHN